MKQTVGRLEEIRNKETRLVIGLMSGTSADGIDAVLTEISGYGESMQVREADFLFLPFEESLRQRILKVAEGEFGGSHEICRLSQCLGRLYAKACLALCEKNNISPDKIDLVGNHGQTVWHMPMEEEYLGQKITGTLQIGEDACIAEALGCPVIGDFRVRDMAAGGLGAPLVPYTEYLLYRRKDKTVALQNIGGIGNVTILPKNGALSDVVAFDTGPGNMVIDALVRKYSNQELLFDAGGKIAASGRVSEELLNFLMKDPYLELCPPKTTGREYYGAAYVKQLIDFGKKQQLSMEDMIATATCFTAKAIAVGIERFSPEQPDVLVVGGGGSHNNTLLNFLQTEMPKTQVITNEQLGYSSDAKEAIAFAILANEALGERCNNVPTATGAKHPVVMGKISL